MAEKIKISKGNKTLEVYEKAFNIVYAPMGFRRVDEAPKMAESQQENNTEIDIAAMSAEELKKVNNADLKAYLDEIEEYYKQNATKDELIALILGEEDGQE